MTLIVALLFRRAAHRDVVDLDVFHVLALARESLAISWVPSVDLFAFTPTVDPSIQHEWGWGFVLMAVLVLGGIGLAALKYGLIGVLAGASTALARTRSVDLPLLVLTGAVAINLADIGFTMVRAQLFTMAALALWLLGLERARTWKGVAAGLALLALWVNIHAGFVVALAALFLDAVERLARDRVFPIPSLALGLGGVAIAAFVNPYGPRYLEYLYSALLMPRPEITEWAPLWTEPHLPTLATFVVAVLLASYALAHRGRLARGAPLLVLAGIEAVLHIRHLSIFAVVWFAVVPGWLVGSPLAEVLTDLWRRRSSLLAIGMAVLTTAALADGLAKRPWNPLVPADRYPVGACDRLHDLGFAGDVYTSFDTGSYVMWRLGPAVRVSMDSRYEVAYEPALATEIEAMYEAATGFEETLATHGGDLALVAHDRPLAGHLPALGWEEVYSDAHWALFARPGLDLPPLAPRDVEFEGSLSR